MEKKGRPPAKTGAERMRALRERKAQAGLAELRGVMLPPELHERAKLVIADWFKKVAMTRD